jgi:hypothetical protein
MEESRWSHVRSPLMARRTSSRRYSPVSSRGSPVSSRSPSSRCSTIPQRAVSPAPSHTSSIPRTAVNTVGQGAGTRQATRRPASQAPRRPASGRAPSPARDSRYSSIPEHRLTPNSNVPSYLRPTNSSAQRTVSPEAGRKQRAQPQNRWHAPPGKLHWVQPRGDPQAHADPCSCPARGLLRDRRANQHLSSRMRPAGGRRQMTARCMPHTVNSCSAQLRDRSKFPQVGD